MGINRKKVVERNNPVLNDVDPFSPFTVGNGEFAFSVDITGLQTFNGDYADGIPLCTMSNWGWHSYKTPENMDLNSIKSKMYDTFGREVGYFSSSEGQEDVYDFLRQNPHRFNLGRIGFVFQKRDGSYAEINEIIRINQKLDLYSGVIHSRFKFEGKSVEVRTCCHPVYDVIAVEVKSPQISKGKIGIEIEFPYASHKTDASDWISNDKHHTEVLDIESNYVKFGRTLDKTKYYADLRSEQDFRFNRTDKHCFELFARGGDNLNFTVRFAPEPFRDVIPDSATVFSDCERGWRDFWESGGVIDFSRVKDPRAAELEKRVVLSQYITKVQCSGSLPPQETGLTCNSWFGKAHLEMHWWHAAHFALWGREELLERSLEWYLQYIHTAEEHAARQGYKGARWNKMVDNMGNDSPSKIAPFLIWQQPHPIFLAELVYRNRPEAQVLRKYSDMIDKTAEFMADFVHYDEENDRYVLGAPLIPAQEKHSPENTLNPTYELEYWVYALSIAQRWRKRQGLEPEVKWEEIIRKTANLPEADGVYLAHENCPETFSEFNVDHPSMLCACGVLPGRRANISTMRNTLNAVITKWQMETTWGWDYPVMAMTAARTGMPELAVDCLLLNTEKNRYLNNGHCYQRPDLPVYIPANGGLLTAVAMMAAGWDKGFDSKTPGFPKDWDVRYEGIKPYV